MTRPPDASSRSSRLNTIESYLRRGRRRSRRTVGHREAMDDHLRTVRLDARAAKRVERDAAERAHRGDRPEKFRLRTLEHDDGDEARVVRRRESREGGDVRVVDVTAVVARDL